MSTDASLEDVTCLGCGCACDDIRIIIDAGRIVAAPNACELGQHWFGDGRLLSTTTIDSRDASLDEAVSTAVEWLESSTNPLVYLAPGLSCEAQRAATAVADLLHARLDSVTSATTLPFLVAAQERGFASATFGEIRNRADVVVYWAVDIATRYPRFVPRYAPDSPGTVARRVIAVDVGGARSTIETVDHRMVLAPGDELSILSALTALVREPSSLVLAADSENDSGTWNVARELSTLLLAGRYIALVIDAEPDDRASRSAQRFDALLALSHALNDRTRCALVALRGNGNRSGAEAVLTAHTGFPVSIDFHRGFPRYDTHRAPATRYNTDIALVLGDATQLPRSVMDSFAGITTIVIGPHAGELSLGASSVAVETGTAGIHTTGTAYRADEVPLPLKAPLAGGLSAAELLATLARRLSRIRTPRRAEGVGR